MTAVADAKLKTIAELNAEITNLESNKDKIQAWVKSQEVKVDKASDELRRLTAETGKIKDSAIAEQKKVQDLLNELKKKDEELSRKRGELLYDYSRNEEISKKNTELLKAIKAEQMKLDNLKGQVENKTDFLNKTIDGLIKLRG